MGNYKREIKMPTDENALQAAITQSRNSCEDWFFSNGMRHAIMQAMVEEIPKDTWCHEYYEAPDTCYFHTPKSAYEKAETTTKIHGLSRG